MSEEFGGDDSAAEAADIVASFGVDPGEVGLDEDSGQQEQQDAPELEQQAQEQEQSDEQKRQAWSRRRDERESRRDSAIEALTAQNQRLMQILERGQAQPRVIQQQQQSPEDPYQELDPTFRRYLQEQLGAAVQAQDARLQQVLAPLLANYQQQEAQRRAEWEAGQRVQAVRQHADSITAEVRVYAQNNPEFNGRYELYDTVMARALERMGIPQEQAHQVRVANAYGMAAIARQLGVNAGFLTDVFIEEMLTAAGAGRRRAVRADRQSQTARNAAAMTQPVGRRGRVLNPAESVGEERDFTARDAAKLRSQARGKNQFLDMINRVAKAADEM